MAVGVWYKKGTWYLDGCYVPKNEETYFAACVHGVQTFCSRFGFPNLERYRVYLIPNKKGLFEVKLDGLDWGGDPVLMVLGPRFKQPLRRLGFKKLKPGRYDLYLEW